jgi:hypothetical protein
MEIDPVVGVDDDRSNEPRPSPDVDERDGHQEREESMASLYMGKEVAWTVEEEGKEENTQGESNAEPQGMFVTPLSSAAPHICTRHTGAGPERQLAKPLSLEESVTLEHKQCSVAQLAGIAAQGTDWLPCGIPDGTQSMRKAIQESFAGKNKVLSEEEVLGLVCMRCKKVGHTRMGCPDQVQEAWEDKTAADAWVRKLVDLPTVDIAVINAGLSMEGCVAGWNVLFAEMNVILAPDGMVPIVTVDSDNLRQRVAAALASPPREASDDADADKSNAPLRLECMSNTLFTIRWPLLEADLRLRGTDFCYTWWSLQSRSLDTGRPYWFSFHGSFHDAPEYVVNKQALIDASKLHGGFGRCTAYNIGLLYDTTPQTTRLTNDKRDALYLYAAYVLAPAQNKSVWKITAEHTKDENGNVSDSIRQAAVAAFQKHELSVRKIARLFQVGVQTDALSLGRCCSRAATSRRTAATAAEKLWTWIDSDAKWTSGGSLVLGDGAFARTRAATKESNSKMGGAELVWKTSTGFVNQFGTPRLLSSTSLRDWLGHLRVARVLEALA